MKSTSLLQNVILLCFAAVIMLNYAGKLQAKEVNIENVKKQAADPILVPKNWWPAGYGTKLRGKSRNLSRPKSGGLFRGSKSRGINTEISRLQQGAESNRKSEADKQAEFRKQRKQERKQDAKKYQSGIGLKSQYENTGFRRPGYFNKNNEEHMWD